MGCCWTESTASPALLLRPPFVAQAKTLTVIVNAKAAAKQDSAEIKQKKADDEASSSSKGPWAVNQGNARCGPGARAPSFGEARANDELAFTSFARVGAGGHSSGRSSPTTTMGRLSPAASTGRTSNVSQAAAGDGSCGRSSPTTSTGGTSNAPQPTAGGASSGRSSTVPPLGDKLAQDMGDITISELAQFAAATREEADNFLNAGFTRDLVRPEKTVAMMTALIDERLLGERGGVQVDECLADGVEYDETDFVPDFGGLVLDALLDNYNVPRHDFYGLTGANAFTNGWHADSNPTAEKFDDFTEQLAKLLMRGGGSTTRPPPVRSPPRVVLKVGVRAPVRIRDLRAKAAAQRVTVEESSVAARTSSRRKTSRGKPDILRNLSLKAANPQRMVSFAKCFFLRS